MEFAVADLGAGEAFGCVDADVEVFAEGRGVDAPADARFLFDGERLGQIGALDWLDRNDVAIAAEVKIDGRRLAEQPVTVGVDADDILSIDRHVDPVGDRQRRPASEFFKFSIHNFRAVIKRLFHK